MVQVPKKDRGKWDKRSEEYIFVGYCETSKGYKCADPSNPRRVIKARDVCFFERRQVTEPCTHAPIIPAVDGKEKVEDRIPSEVRAPVDLRVTGPTVTNAQEVTEPTVANELSASVPDLSVSEEDSVLDDFDNLDEIGQDNNPSGSDDNSNRRYPKRVTKAKTYPDFVLYNVHTVND